MIPKTLLRSAFAGATAVAVMTGCTPFATEKEPRSEASELFRCLDVNDTEFLETGELQNASGCDLTTVLAERDFPEAPKRRAEALINAMDVDGDERISDREFKAWYTQ